MLVTSSGKHSIPLSSGRQRNIPKEGRGDSRIRPQGTDEMTTVSAAVLLITRASTCSLSSISFAQQHPWQAEAIPTLLPFMPRFILKLIAQEYPAESFLEQGACSAFAPAGLLALRSPVCPAVGSSQALWIGGVSPGNTRPSVCPRLPAGPGERPHSRHSSLAHSCLRWGWC